MLGGHQLGLITVQFLFSVPTTWNSAVVDTFKRLVLDAGFGGHNNHTVAVTMTEPEAVAAFEICKLDGDINLQDNDNVLIVDAGGGTGDFCLLTIKEDQNGNSQANELQPVTGAEIGSTYIDSDFESFAASLLEPQQAYLSKSFQDVAWQMRNSRVFQEAKHKFGTEDSKNQRIPIPHLRQSKNGPESCWLQNKLLFTNRDNMAILFDRQIASMQKYITDSDKPPSKRIWEIGIFTSFENDPAQVQLQDDLDLHTIIRVDLSRVVQEDVRVKKENIAKLRFGKKSDVEIDFIVEAEIGLAAVNFQCCMVTDIHN
ncbi:hypothetical protein NW762_006727 [Fusarium torreyae]|uniref:Uncharacterized protein n=1 Tax=Fusarium torreyae TaxID=1237075 RepID=A0A9W8S358_9HYPO|nr:hypothetical protein NW762_006727 [Fusarium torreyae]